MNFFTKQVTMLLNFLMIIVSEAKPKVTKGKRLKILTPKQMLQRLPVALTQIKAVKNPQILLNEIRRIVHSLYQ